MWRPAQGGCPSQGSACWCGGSCQHPGQAEAEKTVRRSLPGRREAPSPGQALTFLQPPSMVPQKAGGGGGTGGTVACWLPAPAGQEGLWERGASAPAALAVFMACSRRCRLGSSPRGFSVCFHGSRTREQAWHRALRAPRLQSGSARRAGWQRVTRASCFAQSRRTKKHPQAQWGARAEDSGAGVWRSWHGGGGQQTCAQGQLETRARQAAARGCGTPRCSCSSPSSPCPALARMSTSPLPHGQQHQPTSLM